LYASPDGSFVFGGSPGDFDMFVGVRNGSSGTNFGGLYYQAGIDEDASQLAANVVGFDSYYGSFSANNGVVVSHQRLLGNGVSYSYTFQDSYAQNSNGTYDDKFTSAKYFGGSGGAVRIGLGVGPFLSISVAVQAPAFSGSGVYLNPAGVVNSASSAPFTAGVARGELITLVGNNLGPDTLQVASTVPFPTTLGNVQVLVNNVPAPIYYVSPNQVAALVPYQTTASVAQIKVVNNGVASNTVTELVNLTAPGVFTQPAGGLGYAAALHTDFSPVTPSSPAQPGETIAVFVTGLGDVFPGIPDGSAGPSPDFSTATNAITADVNGVAANVTYKGLAPGLAGLYQVNIEIPTGLTAGDNFLDVSGPDSYASEALIPIGGGSASPAARAVQRSPARHATPSIPFYPRRLLSEP
jgi:uncharacterized protein (TIGR03437 family)